MNNSTIILSYIGLSQALFSAFLFYSKSKKQIHDRILILLLLTIALRFFLIATEAIHGQFFNAEFSIGLIPLTFGPFILLYTKYLIYPYRKFNPFEILHFAPFLVLSAIYFIVFKDHFSIKAFKFTISISTLFLISSILYSGFVFALLNKFRKNTKQNLFSYDSIDNRLFWLNYISVLYSITYVIYFIIKFYAALYEIEFQKTEMIPSIGLVILTYSVSYFAIKQPNLFKEEEEEMAEDKLQIRQKISDTLSDNIISSQKNESNVNLKIETEEISIEKKRQLEKLNKFMHDSKIYRKQDLTLLDLSKKLNIPKHQITVLLNNYINKNFFEYVNDFRIEETKIKMLDPNFEHLTLEAIAWDCGFNSKSTFNTCFKNKTGHTPTEWRKIQKDQQLKNKIDLPLDN